MSFIELLALLFGIGLPITIGMLVSKQFGVWTGVEAGLFSAIPCVASVVLFYRAYWRRNAKRRQEWKEKYSRVYRVIAVPTNDSLAKKAQGAEIKIGDYGWEAVPLREDGLIYLQGLTPQWRVVWYAGFRPDQIERVAFKPQSQYDWDQTWVKNPPPCPFPVQERETANMGFPMPH
jgi:hypothetical protein